MKTLGIAAVAFSLCLFSGCKSKPCGLGLEVDARPLPESWTNAIPAMPKGATVCYNPQLEKDVQSETVRRSFSLADKSPAEALKAIKEKLREHGWHSKPVDPSVMKEREGLVWWARYKAQATPTIELWCSSVLEHGWCHLELVTGAAAKKK